MGEVVQDNTHVGLSLKGNQKSWKRVQKRCLSPCMHQHDFMLYSCLPPKPINMGLPKLKLLGKSSATQPLHFIGLRPKEEEGFPKVTFMHSFTHSFAVSLQNLSCKPGTRHPSPGHYAVTIPGAEEGLYPRYPDPVYCSFPSGGRCFHIPIHTLPAWVTWALGVTLTSFHFNKAATFSPRPGLPIAATHTSRSLLISASGFQIQTSKQVPFISGL